MKEKRWSLAHLPSIAPVGCPCGSTRRAFTDDPDKTASIHLVEIKSEPELHYHKRLTEIYLVLEGEGHMELDGEKVTLKPMTALLIKPGCRHRAVGKLKIVNVPIPAFDPADEWFD